MQVNTDENTLIAKIMGLVIAVVVVGMVLVPFVTEATITEKTVENDGYFHMQKITAEDTTEYTLEWVKATDTLTLNDEIINIGDHSQYTDGLGISIAFTDNSLSRYVTGLRVQSFVSGQTGSTGYSATTVSINFNNGTETIIVDEGLASEETRTTTYEYAFFASNSGDYEMKSTDKTAAVKSDSELCLVGLEFINNSPSVIKVIGTASDVEFSSIYGVEPTFDDVEIQKTAHTGYVGLYDIDKITATATYSSTDTDIVCDYFVVPLKVTAELSQHASNIEITLYQMIPIFVVLGLIIATVGLFAYNHRNNN